MNREKDVVEKKIDVCTNRNCGVGLMKVMHFMPNGIQICCQCTECGDAKVFDALYFLKNT